MTNLEILRSTAFLGQNTYSLRQGRNTLGRDSRSDICIPDPRISSTHTILMVNGNSVEIFDQNSTNGTFLNQERKNRSLWDYGQLLVVGDTEIALRGDHRETELSPKPKTQMALRETDLDFHIVQEQNIDKGSIGQVGEGGESQKFHSYTSIINKILKTLASSTSTSELLDEAMVTLFQAMQCHTGYILLVDKSDTEVVRAHLAFENGVKSENLDEKLYSKTLVARALKHRSGFIFDFDESQSQETSLSIIDLRIRTAMLCPIHSEGEVFGVIYLDKRQGSSKYRGDDLAMLMNMAGIIGVAVENLQLYKKLKLESMIRDNLKRFVSPNIAERIIEEQGSGNFHLRSQKSNVTIMFTDIRGFTPLSENLTPLEIVQLLNAYFSEMSQIVFKYGGTLDKFIGDGMMVLFNAPFAQLDHEEAAVKAALEMQRCLMNLLPKLTAQGIPQFSMGIGLNYGEAVVGSVGTESRSEYTAIGDCVNVASRVCGVAQPGQVLITEELYRRIENKFSMNSIGPVQLKGKKAAISIYEVKQES